MDMRDELRQKLPKMAKKADGGSRSAAIRLNCLECVGGAPSEVAACPAVKCFLWPYRMGNGTVKRPKPAAAAAAAGGSAPKRKRACKAPSETPKRGRPRKAEAPVLAPAVETPATPPAKRSRFDP